jgi:hypothetical protein
MAKAQQLDEPPVIPAGLVLIGILQGRRRTKVERKDKSVTYRFQLSVRTDTSIERVERWSDEKMPADLPQVNTKVALPVRVRVFQSVIGPQYRLTTGSEEQGEEV